MIDYLFPPLARKKRVGARIATTRKALGMNQKDMAAQLGIAPNRLSMWETGERAPNFEELAKISELTKASTDYLILGRASLLTDEVFLKIDAQSESHDAPVK